MPTIAVDPPLSPFTDIRGSTTTSNTDSKTIHDATNDTTTNSIPTISLTSTSPSSYQSDTSTSTSLTIGSANNTSRHTDTDDNADPAYSGHPATLGARIKEIMTENQLVINTFIAGGLAGATSRTVVSPLERLKIILQVQNSPKSVSSGEAYGGVWTGLRRMWQQEGFQGFMKGNGINVVRILPYSALQFTSYGAFKTLLGTWSGEPTLSAPLRLLAGAGAGIVAVSATYPLDLVRARLSIATANLAKGTSTHHFSAEDAKLGMIGMTKKVYRTEGGVKGLYRGCWATAVGVAPYVSLNFYIYESLKAYVLPPNNTLEGPELVFRQLACGGLAGGTSLLFTHPFDVIRRKLQVVGMGGGNPEFNGAIDAVVKICKAEGFWKGMYRGLTPNIIKVAPSIAVSFYTFETVRDLLAKWEHIEEPVEI